MWKPAVGTLLLSCGFAGLNAQSQQAARCSTAQEFAPVLVDNPDLNVTFKCSQATPFDLIQAIGRQTRIPIGVVLGRETDALLKERRSYDLKNAAAESALREAVQNTGYTLNQEGPVWVLTANDLTSRQNLLLTQRYPEFKLDGSSTMVKLGVSLTMLMLVTANPEIQGFGGSILGSTNDEQLTAQVPSSASTEEIANMIVSQGSKGMWILRVSPDPSADVSSDRVDIEPYQHYSNSPNVIE